ncbi:MAG: hypothetical protein AAB769_01695 [Patescibacteria group bacterium]
MQEHEKLFRKISAKERILLVSITEQLRSGDHTGLTIKKLKGSDFYRLRKKNFRIIFHYGNAGAEIDSIRLRDENTYRGF